MAAGTRTQLRAVHGTHDTEVFLDVDALAVRYGIGLGWRWSRAVLEELAESGGVVAVVVDAELAADRVDGEPPGAVGEEPSATRCEGDELGGVAAGGAVAQQVDGGAGDHGRGIPDGGEQGEDGVGWVAGGDGVDGELEEWSEGLGTQ